jgi:hypothetical protein
MREPRFRSGEDHAMADLDTDGTIFVGKGPKPEALTLATDW